METGLRVVCPRGARDARVDRRTIFDAAWAIASWRARPKQQVAGWFEQAGRRAASSIARYPIQLVDERRMRVAARRVTTSYFAGHGVLRADDPETSAHAGDGTVSNRNTRRSAPPRQPTKTSRSDDRRSNCYQHARPATPSSIRASPPWRRSDRRLPRHIASILSPAACERATLGSLWRARPARAVLDETADRRRDRVGGPAGRAGDTATDGGAAPGARRWIHQSDAGAELAPATVVVRRPRRSGPAAPSPPGKPGVLIPALLHPGHVVRHKSRTN